MDLKEFTKIAFGHYSQIGEYRMKESEINQDFEDYWNDKDTQKLVKNLTIPDVTQQSEPFINSDFAKYLAANYPTLLFDVTTAIESYTELINGG